MASGWKPWIVAFGLTCACADDESASSCLTDVPADCLPQYSPATFPTVFEKILKPTCATGRGTCHTSDAAKGGLVFEEADTSYALLTGRRDGRVRVVAGDPGCSLLVKRLRSTDARQRMPPGPTGLSAGETCTVTRWWEVVIEADAGGKRDSVTFRFCVAG